MNTLVLALAMAIPGVADDTTPSADEVAQQAAAPLTFSVTPGVWLIRLRGSSSWGSGNDLSFDDNLGMDDLNPAFRGEFRVGRDDWGIWIMGTSFSTSGSGHFRSSGTWDRHAYHAGEAFSSSFDITNVAVEGQWNPLDIIGEPNSHIPLFLTLGGHIGVLYTDMKQTLDFGGHATEARGEYASLYGGIQLILRMDTMDRIPWLRKIEFHGAGGAGATLGHDGGTMWNARADLRFFFTDNIAVLFGYRLLELNISNGNYEASPSLQGLYVGATIEF